MRTVLLDDRPDDLALEAFGAGLPVPEATVRAAWRSAVTDLGMASTPLPPAEAATAESGSPTSPSS